MTHMLNKGSAVARGLATPSVIDRARHSPRPPRHVAIPAETADGFDILAFCDASGVRVCFGGLEFDFEGVEEAAAWVRRALSDDHRLRVDLIGKRPYRWALEQILSAEVTREVLVRGYRIAPGLECRTRTLYRQNHRYQAARQLGSSPVA